jgi:protein O-mannosyl-transferase
VKWGAPATAVALLAAALALPSLANGFVYDDVLVIQQNPLVHGLARSAELWRSSYWPAGLLYRPLTSQLFALEWTAGAGRPLLFHAVSLLLFALVTWLVYRLASRIIASDPGNPWPPLFAAALFAVHPVHVEAVAGVVGQAELLTTLFALLAVERYVAWRRAGALSPARRLALAGLTLLAILSKETGYVVPLLLVAAELTVLRSRRERLRETWLLQGCAVAVGLLLRLSVLGSLAGETPATLFRGMGLPARALAMLAVVPQWARLLLWPAHLQAEYGPPALPVSATLTWVHALGLLLLVLWLVLAVRSWTRRPALAFGLLWVLLALAPVSNLLAPTGIVLAERVMFLPSAGLALAAGAALAALLPRLAAAPRWIGAGAAAVVLALLALAAARSVGRNAAWRSQQIFFEALQRDAPRTYRAHFVASRFYYGERRFPEAERAARRALELYQRDAQVHEQLGQVLRVEGRCAEAIPLLEAGVRLAPQGTTLRSRLIECALAVGDTTRARAVAEEAVRMGQTEFEATLKRLPK